MPFAAVITCADSRVSPTLIFDLDRGNLFESRVAGNGVDTGALGTTEFAVAKLGVKVVMVLGHSDCRAVHAAIGIAAGTESFPAAEYGAIGQVLERVVPAIEEVPEAERDPEHCIAANARHQAARIAAAGPVIEPAVSAAPSRSSPPSTTSARARSPSSTSERIPAGTAEDLRRRGRKLDSSPWAATPFWKGASCPPVASARPWRTWDSRAHT